MRRSRDHGWAVPRVSGVTCRLIGSALRYMGNGLSWTFVHRDPLLSKGCNKKPWSVWTREVCIFLKWVAGDDGWRLENAWPSRPAIPFDAFQLSAGQCEARGMGIVPIWTGIPRYKRLRSSGENLSPASRVGAEQYDKSNFSLLEFSMSRVAKVI